MIKIKDNSTIVFTGDSITDGHWQLEEYKPYGKGYVDFVANTLLAENYRSNLRIYNTGIGGNTTRNLIARWQKDVLDLKPDVLSLLIGINDIWRKHEPDKLDQHVPLEEYLKNVTFMLDTLSEQNTQVALIEPFMFCDDQDNKMFADTVSYGMELEKITNNYSNLTFIPMQRIINKEFGTKELASLSDDMVHPLRWAHCWMGLELMKYFAI